jgi:carbonic anhydrase
LPDRGRGRLFCGLDGAIARVTEGEGGAELRLRLLPRFADVLCAAEAPATVLGTKLIMVLGHSGCGAVDAAVTALQKGNTLPGHIADLVQAMKPGIEPVLKQSGDDLERRAVIANVRYNVRGLQQAKPILAEIVAKNEVRVVGAIYDLATGRVSPGVGVAQA